MGQVAVTETGDSVPVRPTVPQQLGQGENLGTKVIAAVTIPVGTKQSQDAAHSL